MLLTVFVLTQSEIKNAWSGLVASTWEFYVHFCLITMDFPGGAFEDAAPACRSEGEMKQSHAGDMVVARLEVLSLGLGISGSSTSKTSDL